MVITLDRSRWGPDQWGVCEVPGWGVKLPADRVLAEMRALGITATELGLPGSCPRTRRAHVVLDRNGVR